MSKTRLSDIRRSIDTIDKKILKLIDERANLAVKAGKVKEKSSSVIYDPVREKEIIEKIISTARADKSILSDAAVENIYMEIISACRNLEYPLKIAFLGPWATFSHQAAMKKFGSSEVFIPLPTSAEVLQEVESSRADFGIIPIENSNEGSVNSTLDLLIGMELFICGEISLKIEQSFLVKNPGSKINKIYSHPHALAQCVKWIERNYPESELIPVNSTAEAAKIASKENSSAAIASEAASKIYKLYVLYKGIQDTKENYTRFLIIGKSPAKPSKKDKTSLVMMIKDGSGSLYNVLGFFNKYKINLTKIESRPTKKKAWEYVFFVDLEGNYKDKKILKVIEELSHNAVFVKVLGSYPQG